MKFLNKKICLFSILLLVPLMISAQARLAKTSPIVAKKMVIVKLESYAKHYRGICPVTVKMTGKIIVPSAMSVKYMFRRSDGSRPKLNSLIFKEAGTRVLPFTWKISKDCNGWVQLIVRTESSEWSSEKFHFDVVCDNKPQVGVSPGDPKIKEIQKPDLIVSGINITDPVRAGIPTFIFIHVKNISNSRTRTQQSPPCNLTVQLYLNINLMLFKLYPIPAIPSGTSKIISIPYNFSPGQWRIQAWADGKEEVSETDETNNVKSFKFYVK